ncbi:flagellar basal body P-ring formation chaperone FlgA [Aliiglaciecola sp. CAU 1673]|uniref:flagellar basal body P-ring formation chaperone FlgA n=1 Tax=Aliiglaciecola sp. CAU 1673 TaxID=3032595 RepID=UPI0023DB5292|nr:flagellar basal body P-ring formation chaperone FlgA [Aliiglaciecola sp. CAU 1673]MDF2178331.1 flagellar basal body P-ring formation chaperone FlgA [Aliiglaciecola sp. CAU 1673]
MKNLPIILKRLRFLPFALLVAGQSMGALASAVNHSQVEAAAIQHVATALNVEVQGDPNVDITMSPLDERIQVPHCSVPLNAETDSNSLSQANVTVRVFCPSSNWFLYVMVKVTHLQDVVVVKTAISPGTMLDSSNLEVVKLEKSQLRSTTFSSEDEVLGARSKRRLRPGQPVEPSQLCFVCKGDSIVIHADMGGLRIKASGIAQQDGNLGDTIMVKNQSSNKIIDAKVTSPNQVSVRI